MLGCTKKTVKTIESIKKPVVKAKIIKEKIKKIKEEYPDFLYMHFDFNKYNINKKCLRELRENVNFIFGVYDVSGKYKKLLLLGHCDERGSNEYNLSLGDMRAEVIKEYLLKAGYPENLIDIISYGEERPIDKNSNEKAWAKNRRVEIKIIEY